jgi:two-component system response regulator AtoC
MPRGRILCICSETAKGAALRSALKPFSAHIELVHGTEAATALPRRGRFHAIIVTLGAATAEDWIEEVLCLLEGREDKTPVIIVAERDDPGLVERFHSAGVFDFMMLPTDRHTFAGVVRRALLRSGLSVPQDTASPAPKQAVQQFPFLIGKSEPMLKVLEAIAKAAETDANVCISGETGTGKELVARAIHYSSHRAHRPMMVLDCTAVSEGLMESEMFGHVKGAFTSAVADRDGVFQLAHGGSLFLDEIGELGLPLQAKLLRVIQCREFRKVGGENLIKVDVRIITATHRNLAEMVGTGTFREDLFYRLEVLSIPMPSLRKRKEDIPLLVDHFIERFNRHNQKQIRGVDPKTMGALLRYDWPGNVRELENCIERAAVMADGPMISIEEPAQLLRLEGRVEQALADANEPSLPLDFKEAEKLVMLRALRSVGGDKTRAAELLGISVRTLYYKLKELDGAEIPRPRRMALGQAKPSSLPKAG